MMYLPTMHFAEDSADYFKWRNELTFGAHIEKIFISFFPPYLWGYWDIYTFQYHFIDIKTKYLFRSYLKTYSMGSEKVECRFSYEELKLMGESK